MERLIHDCKRTHRCGSLRDTDIDAEVVLMGWVHNRRDHGGCVFIDLRDREGLTQVVFDPRVSLESYERAALLREEYVVEVVGKVALREKGTENPNLDTGDVEVFANTLKMLSESKTLPFQISEKAMVFGEDIKANPELVEEDLRLHGHGA